MLGRQQLERLRVHDERKGVPGRGHKCERGMRILHTTLDEYDLATSDVRRAFSARSACPARATTTLRHAYSRCRDALPGAIPGADQIPQRASRAMCSRPTNASCTRASFKAVWDAAGVRNATCAPAVAAPMHARLDGSPPAAVLASSRHDRTAPRQLAPVPRPRSCAPAHVAMRRHSACTLQR